MHAERCRRLDAERCRAADALADALDTLLVRQEGGELVLFSAYLWTYGFRLDSRRRIYIYT